MSSNHSTIAASEAELITDLLGASSGEIFLIGANQLTAKALIDALDDMADPPTVRLLARESVLKWLRDDFVVASAAAESIEMGSLALRATSKPFENALVLTDETVVSLISTEGAVAGLGTDDSAFIESLREHWNPVWDAAEPLSLRTPARSRVEETLKAEFGPEMEADFETMLAALGSARGDTSTRGLDEIGVSLLVAAKHEQLLYDISKWGEDSGVASKATFSRTKTRLEDRGLIETEKVPIEVGRPRLRLVLGDDRLRDADTGDLMSVAQSLLSATAA